MPPFTLFFVNYFSRRSFWNAMLMTYKWFLNFVRPRFIDNKINPINGSSFLIQLYSASPLTIESKSNILKPLSLKLSNTYLYCNRRDRLIIKVQSNLKPDRSWWWLSVHILRFLKVLISFFGLLFCNIVFSCLPVISIYYSFFSRRISIEFYPIRLAQLLKVWEVVFVYSTLYSVFCKQTSYLNFFDSILLSIFRCPDLYSLSISSNYK